MSNKEYAIKQLQELPADEDAVIIIFTKADAEAAIEHEGLKVTPEAWNDIIRDCGKVFPSSEMWDEFSSITLRNAEESN